MLTEYIELRRHAEMQLKSRTPEMCFTRTNDETQRLLHELQVHQIELEMQNTELRQTRDELETALGEYTDLYDFAPVGYFTLDCSGTISAVNLSGASLLNIERSRLIGQPFALCLTEEYRSAFTTFLGKVFTSRGKETYEVALLNKDNITLTVQIEAMATASGKECRLALIDVTERKNAENALCDCQDLLLAVINRTNDSIYVKDLSSRILLANPACLRVLGKRHEDVVGRNPFEIHTDPDIAVTILGNDRRIMESGQIEVLEETVEGPDGCHLFLSYKIPRREADDRVIGLIGVSHDITTCRQTEVDLHSSARRLIEMEEALRKKLAAELHDEIGRDLTVLSMNLAIINNGMKEETQKKYFERIEDSGRLIKGIGRTVRGIMAGLRPPVLDDYGLIAALRWHADLFSKRNGIAVLVHADEHFPRLAAENETALFRISQEALMNVVKHAETKIVTIKLRRSDGMLWFTVADEGNGFIPASSSTIRKESGWGLKLMRERAELIGGNFHVDSAPGKGTVVSVNLALEEV